MTKITPQITDAAGNAIHGLRLATGQAISLRLYPDKYCLEAIICACRADFGENPRLGEDDTTSRGNGQELIDEGMVEARVSGGEWQNICKFENGLNLGEILSSSYKEFEIRVVVTDGAVTVGTVGIGLALRCRGSDFEFDAATKTILGFWGIEGYWGISDSVVIPATIDGLNVASVGTNALLWHSFPKWRIELKAVDFSETSEDFANLGPKAFYNNALESVTLKSSISNIEQYCFAFNNLHEVTIENPSATLGTGVFDGNQSNPEDLTIYGYPGSTAETYATANGHAFVSL